MAHSPVLLAARAHSPAASARITPKLQYHFTVFVHPASTAEAQASLNQFSAGWIVWSARRPSRHLRAASSLASSERGNPASRMFPTYVCMGPCRIDLGRADEGLKNCSLAADLTLGGGCCSHWKARRSGRWALCLLMTLMCSSHASWVGRHTSSAAPSSAHPKMPGIDSTYRSGIWNINECWGKHSQNSIHD